MVVRSKVRDRHTRNFRVWHSQTEVVLTVVRKTQSGKQKNKLPVTRNYDTEFVQKYGRENGQPTNVYKDYLPPSTRCRLRDADGKVLRQNAEKSVVINEYFVELLTQRDDVVVDLFAGTASMALACIKTNRKYYGSEIDETVRTNAIQRIGKTWNAKNRGTLDLYYDYPGH